ncbi:MAG TPA: hypothetical protein VEK11_14295 [Thermoanaerobaculia bacterium]|nr:hypothetical protein [Thermoanaerobaculia bacterium]
MRIALVTWSGLPGLSSDDQLLRDALLHDGHEVAAAVWDDPRVAWESYDAIVIRSTWDYHKRIDEFRKWLASLGDAPLWNPRTLLERNLHKSYLLGMPNAVPTRIVQPGEHVDVTSRVVVKPAVSASAYLTTIAERPFVASFEALVQPFVDEVTTKGEWSLLFAAGEFSHAVLKQAKRGDFRVQQELGGSAVATDPPPALIDDAHAILATIEEPWLYARVDGVERDGRLLLMELEMTEPSLFLELDAEAPRRFARAIAGRCCNAVFAPRQEGCRTDPR